jgi:hypothetical protein
MKKIVITILLGILSLSAFSKDSFCLNYVGECHSNFLKSYTYSQKAYEDNGLITYKDVYAQTVSVVYRATITGQKAYCAKIETENFFDVGRNKFGIVWQVAHSSTKCEKKFKKFNIVDRAFMEDFDSYSTESESKAFDHAMKKCEYYRNLLIDSVIGC